MFGVWQSVIACYRSLAEMIKRALPFVPPGFGLFDDEIVASDLIDGDEIYLPIWAFGSERTAEIDIGYKTKGVEIIYHKDSDVKVSVSGEKIKVTFSATPNAVLLKIVLGKGLL